nr:lipopolysaccharide biosynthesis protein [Aliiroseovarius subalbicans]
MSGVLHRLTDPFRHGFVRDVGILTGGTVAAQAIAVLALPILTRLYAPDDFSLFAVYLALVSIFSTIGCLRYNIAVPLPKEDTDGMNVLVVSLLSATGVSMILALPVLIAPRSVAELLGLTDLAPLLWLVPISVWAASIYTGLQYWASRKKQFGLITKTRITRSAGGVGAQLSLGAFGSGGLGLLFGQTLNNSLGIVGLARSILRRDQTALRAVNREGLRRNARTYRRFPLFSVPEALFNTAGLQVPIMIIAAIAAGPEAGFVLLAMRVMGLPMALIGSSVAQVFLTEAPQELNKGRLGDFTRKTMKRLLGIGAAPLCLVGAVSPFLFAPLFGDEWGRAGVLVAWMTPWFILQFVASPVSMALHVTGQQFVAMFLQAFGLVSRVGAVLCAMAYAPDYIAEIYALSGAVFYGVYLWIVIRVVKK